MFVSFCFRCGIMYLKEHELINRQQCQVIGFEDDLDYSTWLILFKITEANKKEFNEESDDESENRTHIILIKSSALIVRFISRSCFI